MVRKDCDLLQEHLLAVDLGLRTGIALWRRDGRLITWRAMHYPSRRRLRRGMGAVARDLPRVDGLVTEGEASLGRWWREALALPADQHLHVSAATWREDVFTARDRRSARDAKRAAVALARRLIRDRADRGAPTLRHDAAEAICLGFWAGMRRGW